MFIKLSGKAPKKQNKTDFSPSILRIINFVKLVRWGEGTFRSANNRRCNGTNSHCIIALKTVLNINFGFVLHNMHRKWDQMRTLYLYLSPPSLSHTLTYIRVYIYIYLSLSLSVCVCVL